MAFSVPVLVALLAGCEGDPPAVPLPELPPPVAQPAPSPGPQRTPRRLDIAFVGEVRGEIQPCGCPTFPYGGFSRREELIRRLRADPAPLVHLDAGNLLVKGYATGGRGTATERTRLLLDLSRDVGVDAWSPSSSDLLVLQEVYTPEPALRGEPDDTPSNADSSPLPWSTLEPPAVCATWTGADGEPLLPAYRVVERPPGPGSGGSHPPMEAAETPEMLQSESESTIKIGVIGLCAAGNLQDDSTRFQYLDPVLAARTALQDMPEDLDLVVALSNLSRDENRRVADEVEGLPLVLASRGEAWDEPLVGRHALVLEVPGRGRFVTVAHLYLASDAHRRVELPRDDFPLEGRDRIARRLRREQQRAEPDPALVKRLQERLETLEQRIHEEGAGRNLAWVERFPLGTRYDARNASASRIERYQDRVLRRTEHALREARTESPSPTGYASSSGCAACHPAEFARWTLTDHARAMEIIHAREQARNPECITCHTTAFGLEGGWAELSKENLRKFKAVQCESCHGPLAGHPEDLSITPTPVTEATCVPCHDDANSPDFDYAAYLPRASCVPLEDRTRTSEGEAANAPAAGAAASPNAPAPPHDGTQEPSASAPRPAATP